MLSFYVRCSSEIIVGLEYTIVSYYTHCVRKVYHFTILSAIISYYISRNIQIQISVNI